MILGEVCDVVISHCSSRFAVTGHLVAATLFGNTNHSRQFLLFNAHGMNTFNYIIGLKKLSA